MDKNSIKSSLTNNAKRISNTTKSIVGKTKNAVVKTIDQNADNKLSKEDLNLIKEKITSKTKETSANIKATIDKKKQDNELKRLKPIFREDLEKVDFITQKLICISEPDKNFLESDVCKNAIGRYTDYKNMRIITIFKENIDLFDIELFPNNDCTVYYMDPINKNKYIALEDYFDYLKQVRVNELEKIAQDLGAKHFKITLMEEKKTFSKSAKNIKTSGKYVTDKNSINVSTEKEIEEGKASFIEISAESNFKGHEPIEPKLHYLKSESDIQNLINMRMSKNAIENRKVNIRLNKTSGMKRTDAENIDAALKVMKISGNTTIENEYNDESRRFFNYEIEF